MAYRARKLSHYINISVSTVFKTLPVQAITLLNLISQEHGYISTETSWACSVAFTNCTHCLYSETCPRKIKANRKEKRKSHSSQTSHQLNTLFVHAGNRPLPNYKFLHTTLHGTKQILQ